MTDPTLITRLMLKDYRSIAGCDISLGPLTFLVGPNGAGKSNFLDALRLVAESLRASLDHSLRERGGVGEICRRASNSDRAGSFGIRLTFQLSSGDRGFYAFEIAAEPRGGFAVIEERCRIEPLAASAPSPHYQVRRGIVEQGSAAVMPAAAADRLYLVHVSGLAEFRPLYEALSHMGFYNFNLDEIRSPQTPDSGDLLARDGHNLASVLGRLDGPTRQRIVEYLGKVVPGIIAVEPRALGSKETLELVQRFTTERSTLFSAAQMSDGALRALGVLVALLQAAASPVRVPLIGVEEPELALHPGTAGVLRAALNEASRSAQILVTSHSPELLDDPEIDVHSILAVAAGEEGTTIGPVEDVSRSTLRERLFTAGELLRLDQLQPDGAAARKTSSAELFADGGGE
jgi:predicted ATPase